MVAVERVQKLSLKLIQSLSAEWIRNRLNTRSTIISGQLESSRKTKELKSQRFGSTVIKRTELAKVIELISTLKIEYQLKFLQVNVRSHTMMPTLLHLRSIGSMAKNSVDTKLKCHLLNVTTHGSRKEDEEVAVVVLEVKFL